MINKFIERPVLSTVISIIILIIGVLGIYNLPVTQYPDIAPPTVQVRANYPGANAETIIESVLAPIEEQINGVEGMTYMTSKASNDGSAQIQIFFEQGYDPDIAAVNVQNRVARANAVLPADVIRSGVVTQKRQNSALMYAAMYSTSEEYSDTYIQNYLNINVVPELQRINGVGEVNVFAQKDYTMRVWVDPVKLANHNLTPADVDAAIKEQSQEAAAGSIGQNAGEAFEYVIKYKGRLKDVDSYEDIIIKANQDGTILRLKDIAKIEMDAFSFTTKSMSKGYPSVSFAIYQTPGSNAQEINRLVLEKLETLKKDFPTGIDYVINYNVNSFLEASIDNVIATLIEAFLLVFLVVFVFLQDLRSTLIPAIAVPVSIVGTFFFLNMMGFSINLLTLFALILAIGIVVDDAIVVVEAVHAKLEDGEEHPKEASKSAMSEISGAIISITLVMAAVFVPITFIQGPSGVFYQQFGLTLIIAIFISAVNALTLSPTLAALFLKPTHEKKNNKIVQRFYNAFNTGFNAVSKKYISAVERLLKWKWVTLLILMVSVGAIFWTNKNTPSGFVPSEDRGVIFVNLEMPPGTSMDRTFAATDKIMNRASEVEGVRTVSFNAGRNFFSGNGSSYGMGFILLESWEKRSESNLSIQKIIGQLNQLSGEVKDAQTIFFTPPSIPGFGSSDGFEFQLLDKTAGNLNTFDQIASGFVGKLMQEPSIAFASNSFNTQFPQYNLEIDVPKAKKAGISVNDILRTLQGYTGGIYTSDFSRFGKPYKVYIQALPENRAQKSDLNKIFVRNNEGKMAPVSSFVSLKPVMGPQTISRFNLFNAVTINGATKEGYSSGDAIKAIEKLADTELPQGYDIAFSGITREEKQSSGQAPLIIGLSVLFVFFFLAAQYESYLLPFAVLLSLPVGVAGAFLFTYLFGLENNIYFQIALVMLLGLLAKNAILIVEFAVQRRQQGLSLYNAAVQGARVRLRPILMTSFAFILGLLPLVLANGVGAAGNNSIGTGAAGGMLIGTIIGIFIIPVLFVVFQWLQEKISGPKIQSNEVQ